MKPKPIEKYNRWSVAFYPSLGHNTSIDSKSETRGGRREHLSGLSARKNVSGSWLLFAFGVEQPNNPTVVMVFPRGYPKRMSVSGGLKIPMATRKPIGRNNHDHDWRNQSALMDQLEKPMRKTLLTSWLFRKTTLSVGLFFDLRRLENLIETPREITNANR